MRAPRGGTVWRAQPRETPPRAVAGPRRAGCRCGSDVVRPAEKLAFTAGARASPPATMHSRRPRSDPGRPEKHQWVCGSGWLMLRTTSRSKPQQFCLSTQAAAIARFCSSTKGGLRREPVLRPRAPRFCSLSLMPRGGRASAGGASWRHECAALPSRAAAASFAALSLAGGRCQAPSKWGDADRAGLATSQMPGQVPAGICHSTRTFGERVYSPAGHRLARALV
jgi:hypothetical protein